MQGWIDALAKPLALEYLIAKLPMPHFDVAIRTNYLPGDTYFGPYAGDL